VRARELATRRRAAGSGRELLGVLGPDRLSQPVDLVINADTSDSHTNATEAARIPDEDPLTDAGFGRGQERTIRSERQCRPNIRGSHSVRQPALFEVRHRKVPRVKLDIKAGKVVARGSEAPCTKYTTLLGLSSSWSSTR
jgi:hypothetical protein